MKKQVFFYSVFLLGVVFLACENKAPTKNDSLPKLLSQESITIQGFAVAANKDTTLIGSGGTLISLPKDAFVDQNGQVVRGPVEIELKECLSPLDMVMGNLTTTSNGQALESGGMIYLNATSDKKVVFLADDKSIEVTIPCDSAQEGMRLYEGVLTENGMDWQNPTSLMEDEVIEGESGEEAVAPLEEDIELIEEKWCNAAYSVKGYHYTGVYSNGLNPPKDVPKVLNKRIYDFLVQGDGLILTKDSIVYIDDVEVTLVKTEPYVISSTQSSVAQMGTNQFREDISANYIFSVKKLGWANIDRLFTDPRTEQIELVVNVANYENYDDIYVSMLFKNQGMYLPGYQKKDLSYSFTHGDYEKTSLPVGETTTVLVTAYKEGIPFFATETFVIQRQQNIDLQLSATTAEQLKKELEARI